MAQCVILTRCSTEKQSDSGLGLEAQLAACRAFAARAGLDVALELEEPAVSGGSDLADRPVLLDALVAVAELGEGAALVVSTWDRLSRSPLTTELVLVQLRKSGGRVLSADGAGNEDSPEAELMRRIVGAFSAYERAKIALRTRVALRSKAARGERLGPGLFGTRPGEAELLAQARALAAEGRSAQDVATELTRRGLKGRSGAAITATAVRRWLAK